MEQLVCSTKTRLGNIARPELVGGLVDPELLVVSEFVQQRLWTEHEY
jgi:hypothetical protein